MIKQSISLNSRDEDQASCSENLKSKNLIYGLENYCSPLPSNSIRLLKAEIEKKHSEIP